MRERERKREREPGRKGEGGGNRKGDRHIEQRTLIN